MNAAANEEAISRLARQPFNLGRVLILHMRKKRLVHSVLLFGILSFIAFSASAQNIPGSADPGRIEPFKQQPIPDRSPAKLVIPEVLPSITIPDSARRVKVELKRIRLKGVTAFTETELANIYQPYLDQEMPLANLWMIAGKITQRYQEEGYFLSRAYVPAQEINGGTVTIKVVEGYIAEVKMEDASLAERSLIQRLIKRIKAEKPLSAYGLESFMLQMNALPGEEFRAFVEPIEGAEAGSTRLSLRPVEETGKGAVSFDNFGSRFLGPYQAAITYQDSFLPLQQTTFSALTSIPADELQYGAFGHVIPVYPDWTVELSGNYVTSAPGASLEADDIKSDSVALGFGINWQPIRQRQENLIASLELTGKNTNGDIWDNNPLTRDRIRAARGRLSYDTGDAWNGYNYITLGVNHGLGVLGASKAGDLHLSRAEAEPDFTAAQLNYTRQQAIYSNFMAIGQLFGQLASGPLFSAEEFGYGGQAFGRAYDPSEITGDHGIAASMELRYLGFDRWQEISLSPYTFYDIGKVWNEDTGGIDETGSSIGLGMRVNHSSSLAGNLGLAWPLTREISNPIYGNGKNPRILFQLSYGF